MTRETACILLGIIPCGGDVGKRFQIGWQSAILLSKSYEFARTLGARALIRGGLLAPIKIYCSDKLSAVGAGMELEASNPSYWPA